MSSYRQVMENLHKETKGKTGRAEVRVALRCLPEALRPSLQGGRETLRKSEVPWTDCIFELERTQDKLRKDDLTSVQVHVLTGVELI